MKPEQDKEKKQTIGRKALDNLYSMTGLLLSVACCIALIHVELKIQEHHRLISHSIAYCDQMEKEILRKVRQNDGSWQPRHGRQKGSHSGRWHELEGKFLSYSWHLIVRLRHVGIPVCLRYRFVEGMFRSTFEQ